MAERELKADKLRNFRFLQIADDELVRREKDTGKTMTKIIEDLLLGQREFSPEIEAFIESEMERTGFGRKAIIQAAVYHRSMCVHPPSLPTKKPSSSPLSTDVKTVAENVVRRSGKKLQS